MLDPTSCCQGLNPSLWACWIFLSCGRRELATTPVGSCIIQDLGKELPSQIRRERASSVSTSTLGEEPTRLGLVPSCKTSLSGS